MNIYHEVVDMLMSYVGHTTYNIFVNDFQTFYTDDHVTLQKDTCLIDLCFYSSEETMKEFNKVLNIKNLYDGDFPNKHCRSSAFGETHHQYTYRIIVPVNKLSQTIRNIRSYRVTYTNICYYSMSYDTYTKFRQYILENFHLNMDEFSGRVYGPPPPGDNLDDSSFYVAIDTTLAIESADITKTMEDLLGNHCEEILLVKTQGMQELLLAKNIDDKFIAKFNLVKDALDVDMLFIIPGHEYLKQFED